MAKADKYRTQKWAHMITLVTAEDADSDRKNFFDSEYGMSGALLHGDQMASYEMNHGADERSGSPRYDSLYGEPRILGSAAYLGVLLMEAIGQATGREYGTHYFKPKLMQVFEK